MIPILFAPKAREYNNNGLGVLVDVGYCTVTEERNGAFELELQYPVNGSHYCDLAVDCQILAKPNETSDPQAFRIYNITKPMNGIVTVMAEHISYELSSVIVKPFSATSAPDALSKIKSNSIGENPFDFWTDKDTAANMSHSTPLSARSLLGGVSGSVLDAYTGEFEFDNYTVKLHQNRGADNGVVIAYAKNLTGVKCEERLDGVITGVIGYWTSKDENGNKGTVIGDLQTVETELSYSRNIVVDFSESYKEKPTKSKLNDASKNYIKTHKNLPYFSVSVEFVNLGDTEEYKQYKGLHRVKLCDTVTVKHPLYGINVKAEVVRTVFDSVNEKYEKVEIGEASANISQTIVAQGKEISNKVGQSALEKAITNATNAITGNNGGYVVLSPSKQPQELLILDQPNINEAVNVWRWNLAGLGHSSTGYNGDFTTAITADGQIVADFITTGTLDASQITVTNLTAGSIISGVLSSKSGNSYFSLETGVAQFGGSDYYTEISDGSISQYLYKGGGIIGGIIPVGTETDFYECLYYAEKNTSCKGVIIGCKKESGSITEIATFDKEKITAHIPIDCSSATIYTLNTNLLQSSHFVNIDAKNICIGQNGYYVNGYKTYIDGNVYVGGEISTASIVNRSDRKIKENIKSTKTKNALSSIKGLNVYDYDLKDSRESVKMGLMADEAPTEILSHDGSGINLYSYCGLLALAIKQLDEKVDGVVKKYD